jgi:hypothetical protein
VAPPRFESSGGTPADPTDSSAGAPTPTRGVRVSTVPHGQADRDRVAGFLCAFSFALSGVAIARHPGLLAPAAIIVALVAARMTESHRTLAGVAVVVSGLAFFIGMVIAISTDSPLY